MAKLRISSKLIETAMKSRETREGLAKKAREVASEVDALGRSEGVEMEATVEEGTRPKGRPFANVVSGNVDQEWGDRYTERRRILGRVAERNRNR